MQEEIVDDTLSITPRFLGPSIQKPIQYEYSCKGHRKDKCSKIYRPTCGWFNPQTVQCFAYPCASTYTNPCYACKDPIVSTITCGQCPTIDNPTNDLRIASSNPISTQLPQCFP